MYKDLVSVVIPVYNVENYLTDCLDSVFNQTYKDIEVIAINDGSTDNSLQILNQYAAVKDNLIIKSQDNFGQSVARNTGITLAKGKYIYFLDSDDYILPNTFESLITIMKERNLDLIRFSAESFLDNIDMKIKENQYDFSDYYLKEKVYGNLEFSKKNLISFAASPVLYVTKKDVITDNSIKFKPGIILEDKLFTLEVFLNTKRMMYIDQSYYKRRYRPNSTMTDSSVTARKKAFDSRCVIVYEYTKMKSKYKSKHKVKLINRRINLMVSMLVNNYEDIDIEYR